MNPQSIQRIYNTTPKEIYIVIELYLIQNRRVFRVMCTEFWNIYNMSIWITAADKLC